MGENRLLSSDGRLQVKCSISSLGMLECTSEKATRQDLISEMAGAKW